MRAPEEVYKAQQQGAPKAAEELSREERTRLRAKNKRAGKKRKLQQVIRTSPQATCVIPLNQASDSVSGSSSTAHSICIDSVCVCDLPLCLPSLHCVDLTDHLQCQLCLTHASWL